MMINNLSYPKNTYSVNINFDEAHRAWRENKKSLPNGMFRYTCKAMTKKGHKCNNTPSNTGYCHIHTNKYVIATD